METLKGSDKDGNIERIAQGWKHGKGWKYLMDWEQMETSNEFKKKGWEKEVSLVQKEDKYMIRKENCYCNTLVSIRKDVQSF